jgi:hypothetical protein
VLRVSAQLVLDKEGLNDADLAWIDIGFMVTDMGVLLLIIAGVLLGRAARRGQAGPTIGAGGDRPGLGPTRRLPGRDLGDDHEADLGD